MSVTQTCLKESKLNFNHGRILYSLLSKYINDLNIPPIAKELQYLRQELLEDFHLYACLKLLMTENLMEKLLH